jgi:hypothetical protein
LNRIGAIDDLHAERFELADDREAEVCNRCTNPWEDGVVVGEFLGAKEDAARASVDNELTLQRIDNVALDARLPSLCEEAADTV